MADIQALKLQKQILEIKKANIEKEISNLQEIILKKEQKTVSNGSSIRESKSF